mgnify:CR=1 FL=1
MNRRKKIYQVLAALLALGMLLLAAAAVPADVRAEGEGPDEPAPVKPPPITGMNTGVRRSEGEEGEIDPSGPLRETGIEVPLWSEPPPYVEVSPQTEEGSPPIIKSLAVPRRYQDPGDVTCGAAALGMALEFASLGEGTSPPSTEVLVEDLRRRGLLYEGVGTGAEELAYLARNHGYRGSYAFQNWTLKQLAEQLAEGRPPVVALGANGEGQPGHFVTVTGVSEDGAWIRYNDPVWGEQAVSSAEFLRLWGQQGNRGMIALQAPLSAAADPMLPWMGLFGALSMMAVLVGRESTRKEVRETFQALRRKLSDPRRQGLGGRLEDGGAAPARIPVYDWKRVRVGWKMEPKEVPDYETRKVKVGTRTETRRRPRYVMKRVQVGTRTEKYKVKVTRYRTERYTKWVKDTYRVPVYRTRKYIKRYRWKRVKKTKWVRRGWRYYRKTYYKWKRKPVYGRRRVRVGWRTKTRWKKVTRRRRVPYTAYETRTRQVPVYGMQRVQEGWKTETYEVPVYKERKVKVGTRTVYDRVPAYEWQKVQTGWRDNPAYQGESGASTSSGKGPGLNSVVPPGGSNGRNSSDGGNGSQSDYNDEMILFQNRQQRFLAQQAGQQRDQPTGTPPPPTATPQPEQLPTPQPMSTPFPNYSSPPIYNPCDSRNINTVSEIGSTGFTLWQSLKAGGQVNISQADDILIVTGPRASRNVLGFNPYTNRIGARNVSGIYQGIDDTAMNSAISGGTVIGLATNIATNSYSYSRGEIDRYEYAAAMTVDTGITIGSALLAGAVSGAVSGAIAGGVAGVGVGAIPGAIIGAASGALVALAATQAVERTGAREAMISSVADMYKDWVNN